jgi:hypothetical protein
MRPKVDFWVILASLFAERKNTKKSILPKSTKISKNLPEVDQGIDF